MCTDHDSANVVIFTKCLNDLVNEIDVMDERYFMRFHQDMNFRGISHIAITLVVRNIDNFFTGSLNFPPKNRHVDAFNQWHVVVGYPFW